jgi:Bacterial DNA-binding protein
VYWGLFPLSSTARRAIATGPARRGALVVRSRRSRVGRNPRTGVEVTNAPRRVMVFKPSGTLRRRLNLGDGASD